MGAGIAVVGQMHPLNGDRSTVHNDTLFGVVVQHPIAALHGASRSRMYPRPDGTRNLEALKGWSKERRAYGNPGFMRPLSRIA